MGLLFTYVLTIVGAIASIANPFTGLLVYICFAIVKPESMWYWSVPAGNYSRIVAIALLVGWARQGFGEWTFGRGKAVVGCLIGFMACYLFSAILAGNQSVAWADVEAKFKVFLPFLVGVTIIKLPRQVRQLAWVIMLSQGYVAYSLNMSYLSGFNRLKEVGFGGMDNNCNAIAMVCGAGFAFFLALAEQFWWRRWLSFAAAGLMAHAIMISNSRGGMLALMITGAATFVLIPKRPIYYVYLLLAVAVALRLAGPDVWDRFSTTFADEGQRDESAESRLELWHDCITVMCQNPIFGVGPHHFPLVAHEMGWPRGKEAHSLWMQVGAEIGVPGLAFLLAFYLTAMFRLWRLARAFNDIDPSAADTCRMILASLIGFMVAAQFVSLVGLEIPYYVALVGVGCLKLSEISAYGAEEEDLTEQGDADWVDEYFQAPPGRQIVAG